MDFSELAKRLRLDTTMEHSPSPPQEKIKPKKRVTFNLSHQTWPDYQASKLKHLSSRDRHEIDWLKCSHTSPAGDSTKATILAEDLVKQEGIVQESTTKMTKKTKSTKNAKRESKKAQSEEKESKKAHSEDKESKMAHSEEKESKKSRKEEKESKKAQSEEKESKKSRKEEKESKKAHSEEKESKKSQREDNDNKYNLPLVVHSAIQCLTHFRAVKAEIGGMAMKDDELILELSKRTRHTTAYYEQYTSLAKIITILSREAFLCSHRLSQTAIGLHYIEDILRTPTVIEMYNFNENGPITIPTTSFNKETLVKIGACLDHASELHGKFKVKGRGKMKNVLELMMLALDYLQRTAVGALDIFKLLLYVGEPEKRNLYVFFSSMRSVLRVEMLVELQDLRTCIDEIVTFVEKLSFGAYSIFCLSCGVDVAAEDDSLQDPFEDFSLELTPSRHFKPRDDPNNDHHDADVTIDTVTVQPKKNRAKEREEDQKSCMSKEMDEVQSNVSDKTVIWTLDDIQNAFASQKIGGKKMDKIDKSFESKKTGTQGKEEIDKSFASKNNGAEGTDEIEKASSYQKSGAKRMGGGQKSKKRAMHSMK